MFDHRSNTDVWVCVPISFAGCAGFPEGANGSVHHPPCPPHHPLFHSHQDAPRQDYPCRWVTFKYLYSCSLNKLTQVQSPLDLAIYLWSFSVHVMFLKRVGERKLTLTDHCYLLQKFGSWKKVIFVGLWGLSYVWTYENLSSVCKLEQQYTEWQQLSFNFCQVLQWRIHSFVSTPPQSFLCQKLLYPVCNDFQAIGLMNFVAKTLQ